MRPTLAVAVICRNEERDLPRALASVASIADFLCVVDTGSTDNTVEIARKALAVPTTVRTYLEASEQDPDGSWKLWNFSAARNQVMQDAEATGATWVMWLDADDEIKTPHAIKRATYWPEFDYFHLWIDGGGSRWVQTRMWKANKHVRFEGRCHEYPVVDGLRSGQIDESLILHHAEPGIGQENSNPRNERLLLREWEEKQTTRTAFYLASTYKDSGRHEQAAEWFAKRMSMEKGYVDEYLFAALYRARALRALKRHDEAAAICFSALAEAPTWQEFTMELAFIANERGTHSDAIGWAMIANGKPIPETPLFREPNKYKDQPLRLISWCYEHLGEIEPALQYAEKAAVAIGGPDPEWEVRSRRLRAQVAAKDDPPPAIIAPMRPVIALHRPGAIGDILMTLNLITALRAANPDAEIRYFCAPSIGAPEALGSIMAAAGVDLIMDCGVIDSWRKYCDRVIDLVGYPLAEGYPEKPMRRHLLQYFGAEMGLPPFDNEAKLPPPKREGMYDVYLDVNLGQFALPQLTLPHPIPSRPLGINTRYATLQVKAGWSSWKEWPHERWEQVVAQLPFPVVQLGQRGDRMVKGCAALVNGTLHDAIAYFSNATMHLGIDSFTNHLTNFLWTDEETHWESGKTSISARRVPAVVLWGSTQHTASGYPDNLNISKALHCQPCFRETVSWSKMQREPCINVAASGVHSCMDQITVEEVVVAAVKLWKEQH